LQALKHNYMEELGPNIPVESAEAPTSEAPTSKEKKKRRRKGRSREVGSLAAESVIWQRNKGEKDEADQSINSLLEAMKAKKKTVPNPEKTVTEKAGETDETKEEPAEKDETSIAGVAEAKTSQADDTEQVASEAEDSEESNEKLTSLSEDEVEHANNEYLKVRNMELDAERSQAEPHSTEAAALDADAKLLAKIQEKHEADPDKPIEAVAYEALSEVMSELDIPEPEDMASASQPEAGPAAAETPVPQPVIPEADYPETPPPYVPGGGGGGRVPPIGPSPALMGSGPARPSERAPVATSAVSNTEMIPYQESLYLERRAQTRGFLVGGILGYLIGRRRGRIRTEKQLKPIQEKLEKQVNELHDVIAFKERQIRTAAAEKARAARIPAVEALVPAVIAVEAVKAAVSNVAPTAERPLAAPSEQPVPHSVLEASPQIEPNPASAFEILAAPAAAALSAERQHQSTINLQSERSSAEAPVSQIDSLSVPELLEVAAHVNVGKENLGEIFANHRITEPGLRHILNEYVRGGNVKKVLKQELINKELTYERDPRMRKGLAATLSGAGAAAGVVATVAAKAKPKVAKHSKRLASASKKVGSKAIEKSRQLEQQDQEMRQFIVRLWLGVTVFLALVALVLFLS
jgi:hypothetical protein